MTLQGTAVKMAISAIGGTYEGKLSPDGGTITGTWTQGPQPISLNLVRVSAEAAWEIPKPPPPPTPMRADADPSFEVATIKFSRPEEQGKGFRVRGRNFSTINTSVTDIIMFAYGVHARQIVGAPAWFDTEKYDITAKPDGEGQPSDKQWKAMVQKLLAERFKFAFHREKKELSVYAIVLAKGGSKMTKSEGDPNGLPGMGFRGLGALNVRNAGIEDFARLMQATVLDRPVVDHTGLTGRFDFALNWAPDELQFGGAGARRGGGPKTDGGEALPDLFAAMQAQIGLKMEATKAPVEVMVVEKAERASEN